MFIRNNLLLHITIHIARQIVSILWITSALYGKDSCIGNYIDKRKNVYVCMYSQLQKFAYITLRESSSNKNYLIKIYMYIHNGLYIR